MIASTPEHAARVLGLDVQTTLADVRKVRRAMAFKYHPDQSSDQDRATRHMARINAAADVLNAHVKKLTAARAAGNHPRNMAGQKRGHATQAHQKPAGCAAASDTAACATRSAKGRPCNGASNMVHCRVKELSDDERALARKANAVYRSSLGNVGKMQPSNKIDEIALQYPKSL